MRVPKHIGVIPDGNRRWAVGNGLSKEDGYFYGIQPGIDLLKRCIEYDVEEVSIYGYTVDNMKRSNKQSNAFKEACLEIVRLVSEFNCYLLICGKTNSDHFPEDLKKYSERTKIGEGGIKINILINYDWQYDLNHNISSEISRMDLIIRWGGRRRLSGFLPRQSVYSDIYILDKYWPDYEDSDFTDSMEWYDKQDVTLGG